MKKLFYTILTFFILCSISYGAGSAVVTSDNLFRNAAGELNRMLTFTFTGDATTGVIPPMSIYEASTVESSTIGVKHGSLRGWHFSHIEIDARTAVHNKWMIPDNSEIYVKQYGIDLLSGQGVNAVQSSVEGTHVFACDDSGNPVKQLISSTLSINIEQESAVEGYGETDVEAIVRMYLTSK